LDAFPHHEHLEHITDSETQPPPPPLPQTESNLGASAVLSTYIAESLVHDSQDFFKTNLQNNPYYTFVTCEEYKYIHCGIKKKGMTTYYDNVLNDENAGLGLRSFNNRDGVQKLAASMPADAALGEWELHTLEDMKWKDNHQ
jgi:hypothetical protein